MNCGMNDALMLWSETQGGTCKHFDAQINSYKRYTLFFGLESVYLNLKPL